LGSQEQALGYIRKPSEQKVQLVTLGRITISNSLGADTQSRADSSHGVTRLGRRAHLDGTIYRYVALYKPFRVLCAFIDTDGRSTLADYIPTDGIEPAGRLDYDSEGLLILTNDGWLSHLITHPDYEHPKTYLVQVEGVPDERSIQTLRSGVMFKDKISRPALVDIVSEPNVAPRTIPLISNNKAASTWLRVVLYEGRKRQLRHMTASVGYPTLRLIRTAIGPVHLGSLEPGCWRDLDEEEMQALGHMPRLLRQRSK
jgi:23S rRNA pseudouridine2457 synthase